MKAKAASFGVFFALCLRNVCVFGSRGHRNIVPSTARAGYSASRKLKAMSTLLPQEHPLHPGNPCRWVLPPSRQGREAGRSPWEVGGRAAGTRAPARAGPARLPPQELAALPETLTQEGPGFPAASPCPQRFAKFNCSTRSLPKCHPRARVPECGGLRCQAKSIALRPTPRPCPQAGRRPAARWHVPSGDVTRTQ